MHDNIVGFKGFNIIRTDRTDSIHEGVCIYINNPINFTVLKDLKDPSFETIRVKLRPARLPRSYSSMVVGTLYHSRASDLELMEYLSTTE